MEREIDEALALRMYRKMLEIRRFEEKVDELYAQDLIYGNIHSCIGQEAVAVGVCFSMRPDDYMTSTHRGHGYCLAKGGEPKRAMAELFGKRTGYCKGKGGSMHIADFEGGNIGANGIVGAGLPIATGAAISIQNKNSGQVAVCFFGDGASNQGTFHESLNLAAIWKLPVVYVCENNQYALSTPIKNAVAIPRIADRASAYGIPGIVLDGNDVIEVMSRSQEAIDRARNGKGPTLLECITYRFRGHYAGDMGNGILYRSKEEMEQWTQKCPIVRLRAKLQDNGILNEEKEREIEAEIEKAMLEAVKFAEESPFPESGEAIQDLFVEPILNG